jgi:uncharacterized protein YuzE
MLFRYDQDTDMLYIALVSKVSTESEEVAPGIVLDFDENNQVIGIEIEDASKFIDLSKLEVASLPIVSLILNNKSMDAEIN